MENNSFFIADDHQIVIDGLETIINSQEKWKLIGVANDGKTALDKINVLNPDVVLLDIDMPIFNGIEVAKHLLKTHNTPKIVILTMHEEPAIINKLIKLGVHGFFLKNTDKSELIAGLGLILSGKNYYQSEAVTAISRTNEITQNMVQINQLGHLTSREISIIKEIASGQSTNEIADQFNISPRTVETHRKNIHHKLDVKNVAGIVRFAIKSGIIE